MSARKSRTNLRHPNGRVKRLLRLEPGGVVQEPLFGNALAFPALTGELRAKRDLPTRGILVADLSGPTNFRDRRKAELAAAKFDVACSQMPILATAFGTKLTAAAWRDKPSYAIVATEDRWLDPEIAADANRAGSKVTVIKGGQLIHISHPRAVARVIETAARAVK